VIFTTMPEEQLLALTDGEECILQDVDDAARERVRSKRCPECSQGVMPVVDPDKPFDNQTAGFRYVARCTACGCVFDPESGVIRKIGCSSPILPPTTARVGG